MDPRSTSFKSRDARRETALITYIILYLDCDKNFAQGSIKLKRDIKMISG